MPSPRMQGARFALMAQEMFVKKPVVPLLYTPPKLLPLIPVYTERETNSWAQGSSSRANAGLKSAPLEGTQPEKERLARGILRCRIKMLQEYQHSPGCLHHKLMQLKTRLEASWKEKPNRGARASPPQPSRAQLLPDPRGKEPAPGGLERAGPATRRISPCVC